MGEKALLVLKDGKSFSGVCAGNLEDVGYVSGEVVFNTVLTGYHEVITDPSYKNQIIVFTYPYLGNYGVSAEDFEREVPFCKGVIARQFAKKPSSYKSALDINSWLKTNNLAALVSVDTRSLTRHLRSFGALEGAFGTLSYKELLEIAQIEKGTLNQDLVSDISPLNQSETNTANQLKIVVIDYGVKLSTIRYLSKLAKITVVPALASAKEILEDINPDGVLLSNGPGDPAVLTAQIQVIKNLIGRVPIFGICLGHQLLAQAFGAKTYKLTFGHHGGNHPVLSKKTNKIEITSQNHNYAVDPESLGPEIKVSHINLNDSVVEGIYSDEHFAFGVQYHPEASPGPHDSLYLFNEFLSLIKEFKENA